MDSTLRMARNEIRYRARLTRIFEDVPPVLGTELGIAQVFLNTIVAASRAIEEGQTEANEISVEIRADGANVVVSIGHSGKPPRPEELAEPARAYYASGSMTDGSGLGLLVSQRLVASFGGTLQVRALPSRGTVVRISLPAVARVCAPNATNTAVRVAAARRGSVLVIVDEPANAEAIRRILSLEHDVVVVDSGMDALERIRVQSFNVILCDLMMPNMTGMDLFARLTSFAPNQANAMIFLTGGAFTAKARAFLETTHNQCIEKPFEADELRALVRQRVV